jgi:hypothetical protein
MHASNVQFGRSLILSLCCSVLQKSLILSLCCSVLQYYEHLGGLRWRHMWAQLRCTVGLNLLQAW